MQVPKLGRPKPRQVAVPVIIEDGCKRQGRNRGRMQAVPHDQIDGVAVPAVAVPRTDASCSEANGEVAVPVAIEDGCKHNLPVRVAVPVIIEDGCKWDRLEAVLALGRMQARRASEVAVPVIIEDGCK